MRAAKRLEKERRFSEAVSALVPVVERHPNKKRIIEYFEHLRRKEARINIEIIKQTFEPNNLSEKGYRDYFELIKSAMDVLGREDSEVAFLYESLASEFPEFLKRRLIESDADISAYAKCLVGHDILFGAYKVDSVLGTGATGVTFLCTENLPNRKVAVKLILSGELSQVENEATLQDRMRRSDRVPNILRTDQIGDDFYLVMDYVEGSDLRQMMWNSNINHNEALSLAIQLCEAIEELHAVGIHHLDIKPENILIEDNTKAIKITDFGIARYKSSKDDAPFKGTPHYVAPEVVAGTERSALSDIYSLGVVIKELFENIKARGSFQDFNFERIFHICEKVSVDEPAKRYQSVEELKVALAQERIESVNEEPLDIFSGSLVKIPAGQVVYLDGMIFKLNGFLIDRNPITFKQYNEFLVVGMGLPDKCPVSRGILKRIWTAPGYDWLEKNPKKPFTEHEIDYRWDSPIDNITWIEAIAFCNWRSIMAFDPEIFSETNTMEMGSRLNAVMSYSDAGPVQTGTAKGFRLPTEFELELAKQFIIQEDGYGITTKSLYEYTTSSYLSLKQLKPYIPRTGPIPYIKNLDILVVNPAKTRKGVPTDRSTGFKIVFRCVRPYQPIT